MPNVTNATRDVITDGSRLCFRSMAFSPDESSVRIILPAFRSPQHTSSPLECEFPTMTLPAWLQDLNHEVIACRLRARSAALTAIMITGENLCRGLAIPMPASWFSAWRRVPTDQIAPAVLSPETHQESSCIRCCTKPDLRT